MNMSTKTTAPKKVVRVGNDISILRFIILLSTVFWNPLSLLLLFHDEPLSLSWEINIVYWVVFVASLVLFFVLKKRTFSEKSNDFLLSIYTFFIIISVLALFNKGIEFFIRSDTNDKKTEVCNQCLFPPNSKAEYKTSEFYYIARINDIGLRDNYVNINRGEKFRILCFGDSWTYGWGVELEDSWPKKLERALLSNGFNVEVINAGRGGLYPTKYKEYMDYYVPLLKPDLVLVGFLQGDDLAQIYENDYFLSANLSDNKKIKRKSYMIIRLLGYFKRSFFGNFIDSFSKLINKGEVVTVKENWKNSVDKLISGFNKMQKLRFFSCDNKVRDMFTAGDLNPGLLNYYINFPERQLLINDSSSKIYRYSVKSMEKIVSKMKKLCDRNNSKLIFINMPTAAYTGHKVIRAPVDKIVSEYIYQNNIVDLVYNKIAKENNIEYIELTKHFKSLTDKQWYFFKYDGHPNVNGYQEIAKYISKEIIKMKIVDKSNNE